MAISSYLESLPLNNIEKYADGPPKNAVPFIGYPQQHPSEKNKLILIYDPLGSSPGVLEFRLEDVLFIEEVHSVVTRSGEGVPLVKLWVHKGAHGVILEPFEVEDPVQFAGKRGELRERFLKLHSAQAQGAAKNTGPSAAGPASTGG
ncbi:hypothetical protein AGMMS49587_20160 [Spirochaetia bacterium]|nr:hypothetical protein AGMMS49587_20160 [Spirochaetia bacterium]